MKSFRWNAWNQENATKHGVSQAEAERIVKHPSRGYPRKHGGGKWIVIGRGQGGRLVEVIYVVDPDDILFIIHAMPLTTRRRRS